jgi:hypothetical protein
MENLLAIRIIASLSWLVTSMDYTNRLNGTDVDSDELTEAKGVLYDLMSIHRDSLICQGCSRPVQPGIDASIWKGSDGEGMLLCNICQQRIPERDLG